MILQAVNKQQPHYKIVGLTLIEMMLVVTIIAVATLTGIKILKNRTQTTIINTVVTQMQSVAQGVITYYMVNKNQWPTTSATPTTLTTLVDVNAKYPYFSQQTLCTPFPADNTAALCKNFAEIQGQHVSNTSYYNIVLKTDSNSSALAIAGKLPNAVASGTTVTMSITPPAQYFSWNPNKGWIVSAGVVSFDTNTGSNNAIGTSVAGHIYIPNCPTGFEGHIMFAPERYQTIGTTGLWWGMHMAQVTASGGGGKNDSSTISNDPSQSVIFQTNVPDSHGKPTFAITVGDEPDTLSPSVQHLGFFMTFCLPIGHWGTNYINTDWPQDGQCSTSWLQFLQYQKNPNPQCDVTKTWHQLVVGSPNGY